MNTRTRRGLAGFFAVAAAILVFLLWRTGFRSSPASTTAPSAALSEPSKPVFTDPAKFSLAGAELVPSSPAVVLQTPSLVPPAAAPLRSVPASSALVPVTSRPSIDEVGATARMYAAHAPLRVHEVADPDSEGNRRILQTMVEKALVRTSAPASAHAASSGTP